MPPRPSTLAELVARRREHELLVVGRHRRGSSACRRPRSARPSLESLVISVSSYAAAGAGATPARTACAARRGDRGTTPSRRPRRRTAARGWRARARRGRGANTTPEETSAPCASRCHVGASTPARSSTNGSAPATGTHTHAIHGCRRTPGRSASASNMPTISIGDSTTGTRTARTRSRSRGGAREHARRHRAHAPADERRHRRRQHEGDDRDEIDRAREPEPEQRRQHEEERQVREHAPAAAPIEPCCSRSTSRSTSAARSGGSTISLVSSSAAAVIAPVEHRTRAPPPRSPPRSPAASAARARELLGRQLAALAEIAIAVEVGVDARRARALGRDAGSSASAATHAASSSGGTFAPGQRRAGEVSGGRVAVPRVQRRSRVRISNRIARRARRRPPAGRRRHRAAARAPCSRACRAASRPGSPRRHPAATRCRRRSWRRDRRARATPQSSTYPRRSRRARCSRA